MSSGFMADDITMNMTRNKSLECHVEGVDGDLKILRTK